ncbi:MAG: DUF6456 domain-containing protein [Hyphomicrobiales bacterium]
MKFNNPFLKNTLKIFYHLERGEFYLSRHKIGSLAKTACWGLFKAGAGQCTTMLNIKEVMVQRWLAMDWLEEIEKTGRLRLSSTGLAWYRRALAQRDGAPNIFASQHRIEATRLIDDGQTRKTHVKTNETETPLGWLRRRKGPDGAPFINEAQYDAGERLRVDFTIAGMSAHVTSNWDKVIGSRRRAASRSNMALDVHDRVLMARERLFAAFEAVGPELTGILVEVCCLANGLEAAERTLGWPQRSGKIVLKLALTSLARHYGLLKPPQGTPSRATSIRHWGMEGYRPSLPDHDGGRD